MQDTPKITTHTDGRGYFTAAINGIPLIGDRGGYSKFATRNLAKEAAKERLQGISESDRKRLGL